MKYLAKRLIDITIAFLLILILLPLFFGICLIIRFRMGTPVFFYQSRPGKGGRIFRIYKFRTMKEARDINGKLLPDEMRLTKLGKLLRNTSLDELPELFNVLKGEMSLVGPRPLLPEYLDRYTSRQSRRHEVKPGITGWAQVNGRNSIPWEEKLSLDVWYVDNWNIWLDIRIMIMTILKVLKREGISSPTNATMEPFAGSKTVSEPGCEQGNEQAQRRQV